MNTPTWQQAASFAARAHQGQLRKDGKTPYVAHVVRVAMTVRDVFGCDDPVALCTAFLHDTIEDTVTDYDAIHHRFGTEVADCVAAMSKNMLLPDEAREADYDARLATAPWQARIVKLADVYDNGHDLERTMRAHKNIERCHRALELTRQDLPTPCFITAHERVKHLVEHLTARAD